MPIYEGDRVRTASGQEGTVELTNGGGTLAYVRLDENPNDVNLSLYESHALQRIDTTDHNPADQSLEWGGQIGH